MRIGFSLPQNGGTADQPASIIQFAHDIERRGSESLWVGDRALAPVAPTVGFGRGYAARWRSSHGLDNAESGKTRSPHMGASSQVSVLSFLIMPAIVAGQRLMCEIQSKTVLDVRTQVSIRMGVGYVARRCRAAVEPLLDVNGAGGLANANPLQRVWRDIEVASRHGIINPLTAREAFGEILVSAEKTIIWGG